MDFCPNPAREVQMSTDGAPEGLEALQRAADEAANPAPPAPEATPPADPPAADPPAPVAPTPPADPPATPPPPADPPPAEDDLDLDPQILLRQFDRMYGHKLAEKFKSDEDWLDSVDQLTRKIGERDEDAELGRRYRDRADEIDQFLAAPPAKPADQAPPEWDPAWQYQITQNEDGDLIPAAGAPKDVVEKHQRFMRHREQKVNEFVRDPESFLTEVLAKKTEELQQQSHALAIQAVAKERERLAVDSWASQNAALLWKNGDANLGPSDEGVRIAEIYGDLEQKGMESQLDRLEIAAQLVQASRPAPNPTITPPAAAIHQPAVAPPPEATEMMPEDYMEKEGLGLADALLKYQKQLAATAA